ncbi:hypothetical protein M3629_17590 [Paenibacillus polysaccharolyticus]|uniref:phage lytic cycle repressor MrpR family protein n=1 Tax=Paenibacillus polysaccharolyticus TaxID=582692 RepID=UPI002042219F|nr:hypothetical protein [Paenibacillus polysaccharolyticus]MCM3134606.1 hypothetical protein [Paenibacillus polysaccharolyticus]
MNKIYDDNLYNESQKERFLQRQNANTKEAYSRVLRRASAIEKRLGMDLYDFNLNEIKQVLLLLQSTKLATVKSTGSIIQNYIRWAIEQDLRKDNINPLDAVSGNEFFVQFVDDNNPTLFSEEDIGNVVDGCLNFQDKAIVQAIFEGVMGKENSELLNMKMEHITQIRENDEMRYKIMLFNDGRKGREIREIAISDYLYNILRIANKEERYVKNNGVLKPNIKTDSRELIDNDYIVRSAVTSKMKQNLDEPTTKYLVQSRLTKIAEWYNLPQLTVTNLRNSGMLKMARELYIKHGKLEKEEYNIICEHYNVGKQPDGSYAHSKYKVGFLNMESLSLIYDIGI